MSCAEEEIKSGKLLIRSNGSDVGQRPIEPCTNYWSSPNLFLQGGPSRTQAREGQLHTINVTIKNISTQTVENVNVEAWVCDYTAGPQLPIGILNPPDRMTGFRGGLFGPGETATIACAPTWTPTSAQVALNGGHLCLAANAWAEGPPPDGKVLGPGETLKVCCDSHHAQCNISLIGAGPGGGGMGMMLQAPEEIEIMPMIVEISPITGRVGFGLAEKRLLRSHTKLGRRTITLSRRTPKEFALEVEGQPAAQRLELEVDSNRGTQVQISVGTNRMERNTLQLYDITTRDPRTRDVIGGARLMVVRV